MAENGTVAYITEADAKTRVCDICKYIGTTSERESPALAKYDLKTKDGRWANVCENHRKTHAMFDTLGIGKGQRLEVRNA